MRAPLVRCIVAGLFFVLGCHGSSCLGRERAGGPPRVCPSAREPDGGWVTVDGIDTSDYQIVDWDTVARENPHVRFAFVRASSGLARVDTRFAIDWPAARRVGLLRGAYQYFIPSQSAVLQADLFLARLAEAGGLEAGDLPPVLDLEATNGMPAATVMCRARLWLARVERATHKRPILYTSHRLDGVLALDLARHPLWVPTYVKDGTTCPAMPAPWKRWTFWQHAETGVVWGVYTNAGRDDGGVIALQDGGDGGPAYPGSDVDRFDGRLEDLLAFVDASASTTAPPDPAPPAPPPRISGAPSEAGVLPDCSDGCCVAE